MQRGVLASAAVLVMAATVAVAPGAGPVAAVASSYRVEAGGPRLGATPPWTADSATSPSPYVNAAASGNRRRSTTTTIIMRNPSLPPGTPAALFRTARTAAPGARLTWRFPVPAGSYAVRLFFAEIDPNKQVTDARMFDVTVGGSLVLDNFDIFAATGGYTGSMRSFLTTATSEIVVDMAAVTGPPLVSAIEVVPAVPPTDTGGWRLLPDSHYRRSEQTLSYSSVTGRFYLVGGIEKVEGIQVRRLEEYNPLSRRWATVATLPSTLNHVQAVELGGLIYYLGGWATPNRVYSFNPVTRKVVARAPLPKSRGGGGVAVHNGRIYYAGGLEPATLRSTSFFAVYNPATNTWAQLPDMPRARDHFGAAVVNGKFYAIGGRHVVREQPVVENDVYDFATGRWSTGLAPLPSERSGTATAVLGGEILILGGERIWSQPAKKTVEAYNPATDTWRRLPDMAIGAHGIQAAVCNGGVYVAAGATTPGAKDPSTFFQVYFPGPATPCQQSAAIKPMDTPPLGPLGDNRRGARANGLYCAL